MNELVKALVAARKEMGSAKKTSENPHFRSKYADLSAVIEAVKHPLEKHGLTFVQDICDHHVVTVVMHEAGEQLRLAPFPILAGKPDAQGNGSALSYARRYSLQTALGVPAEDDDGNAANRLIWRTLSASRRLLERRSLAKHGTSRRCRLWLPQSAITCGTTTSTECWKSWTVWQASRSWQRGPNSIRRKEHAASASSTKRASSRPDHCLTEV